MSGFSSGSPGDQLRHLLPPREYPLTTLLHGYLPCRLEGALSLVFGLWLKGWRGPSQFETTFPLLGTPHLGGGHLLYPNGTRELPCGILPCGFSNPMKRSIICPCSRGKPGKCRDGAS